MKKVKAEFSLRNRNSEKQNVNFYFLSNIEMGFLLWLKEEAIVSLSLGHILDEI